MKKILIYGDSNTWGDNFFLGRRISEERQWPNILQEKLGKDYKIISEGLPGRVAGSFDEKEKYKNGKDTFLSIYKSHAPIDILIISLGSNDLQRKYNRNSKNIINDLIWYKDILKKNISDLRIKKKYFKNGKMPRIIYIMPINFNYGITSILFNKNSNSKRLKIIDYFINSNNEIITLNNMPLFKDGIHMNYKGHEIMSEKVYNKITQSKKRSYDRIHKSFSRIKYKKKNNNSDNFVKTKKEKHI